MIYIADRKKIVEDIIQETLDEMVFQLDELDDCMVDACAFYSPYTDKVYINGVNEEEMNDDWTEWNISGIGDYHENIEDYCMTAINHELIHKVLDDIEEDDGHDLLDYMDER